MKKKFRAFALVLCACMMFSMMPMQMVYATDIQTETDVMSDEENTDQTKEDASLPDVDKSDEEDVSTDDNIGNNSDINKGETPQNPQSEENSDANSEVSEDSEELEVEGLEEEDEELDELQVELSQSLLRATNSVFTVSSDGTLQCNDISALTGEINISELADGTVKIIPAGIFTNNTSITKVVIPSTVTSFGNGAFSGCTGLTTVEFENNTISATSFSEDLFRGCSSLAYSAKSSNFKIPSGVVTIEKDCFKNCTELAGIDFTNATTLTTIKASAFEGCTSLYVVKDFDKTQVATIGESAFSNTSINQTICIPSTLVEIGTMAFANCSKLYSLDLSQVASDSFVINSKAFSGSAIRSISLPDNYHTLKSDVFTDCDMMTSITLGSHEAGKGVTKIEAGAFTSCDKLSEVILNESVIEVANNAFSDCSGIKTIKSYNGKTLSNGNEMTLYYESFPIINGLTVYGYGGNIEDWAGKHTNEGVSFSSLYTGLEFIVNEQKDGNKVSVTTTGSNASLGATAKITTSAASGYTVISVTHGTDQSFAGLTSGGYTFNVSGSDVNSDGKVPVNVAFANTKDLDTTFGFEIQETDYVKYANRNTGIEIETLGQSVPLKIRAINSNYGSVLSNPALWTYKSSNTSFVTVDASGKVKAIKSTQNTSSKYVTVTATLKANSKIVVKAQVSVDGVQTFDSISDVSFNPTYKMTFGIDENTGLQAATVSRSWVELATTAKGTRNFDVTVNALDTNGNSMETGYSWSSANTSIAKVAAAKTTEPTNTIKICGVGETTITATSTEKSATTKKVDSISFIVRVVDKTPIVEASSIVINTKSTEGTDFNIIRSYGGSLSENLEVGTFTNKKWISKSDEFSASVVGAPIERNDGDYTQVLNIGLYDNSPYAKKEANVNNLYIKCLIDEKDYEYIKLPTVKITAKLPTPKVSISGKVNVFYKATANTKADTSVIATVGTVSGYELDTTKEVSLESLETDTDNIFEENFAVEAKNAGDYSQLRIYQKTETPTLKTDSKNKPVLTGYLVLPYKGGIESKIKITIGTQNVAPSYVLSQTTVTTNKNAVGQEFDIQLLDKKTKETIDLDETFSLEKYESKSTKIFTTEKPDIDTDADSIKVTMPNGLASNAKAIIVVQNSDWNKSLTYPLTVKVDTKNPSIVLNSKTITINTNYPQGNSIASSFKESYMVGYPIIEAENIETTNRGKDKTEAEKITFSYNSATGVLSAAIPEETENQPAKKSYKFTVPYSGEYIGGETFSSSIGITVTIDGKTPTIKLKSNSFTLNDYLCGVTDGDTYAEIAKTTYTFQNVPSANAYTIDLNNAILTNTRTKVAYEYNETNKLFDGAPVNLSFTNGTLGINLTQKLNKTAASFKLSGVKVNGVTVNDIAFNIKSIDTQPRLTLRPSGTINVLDSNSAVTYKVSISNYSGTIDPNKLQILSELVPDSANSSNSIWKTVSNNSDVVAAGDKEMLAHFWFDYSSVSNQSIKLVVNDYSDLTSRNYNMNVNYVFGSGNKGTSETAQITVKPTQKMPKVTLSKNALTLYTSNTSYGNSLVVTSKDTAVSIDGIEWSNKAKDLEKNAFGTPTFDSSTGKLTIKIKNAALLKKNTKYTLRYCITNDQQLTGNNLQGTEFTVTVTVK